VKGCDQGLIWGIIPTLAWKWGNQVNLWAQTTEIWTHYRNTTYACQSITMFDTTVEKKKQYAYTECNVHTKFRKNRSLGSMVERAAYRRTLTWASHKPNVYPQTKYAKRFIKHAISFQHVNYASSTATRALQMSFIQPAWKTNSTKDNIRSKVLRPAALNNSALRDRNQTGQTVHSIILLLTPPPPPPHSPLQTPRSSKKECP
jgi:hypothetical protein